MVPGQTVPLSPPNNFREHVPRPDFRPSGLLVKRSPEPRLQFRSLLLRAEIGPPEKRGDGFAATVANAERLGLARQRNPADISLDRPGCRENVGDHFEKAACDRLRGQPGARSRLYFARQRAGPRAEEIRFTSTPKDLLLDFGRSPGTTGNMVFRREIGADLEFSILQRFAKSSDHEAWLKSPRFQAWVRKVAPALPTPDRIHHQRASASFSTERVRPFLESDDCSSRY